jgi:hypothetical protein
MDVPLDEKWARQSVREVPVAGKSAVHWYWNETRKL